MFSKYLLSVLSLVTINLGTPVLAQEVVFPASIQACIDTGDCSAPVLVGSAPHPLLGPPLMRQYRLTFHNLGTDEFLYRYSLGVNSGFRNLSETTPDGPTLRQFRYSNAVWLRARESYSLSAGGDLPHTMTLYTEQITGEQQFEAVGSFRGEITLRLSSEALLAGEGSFSFNVDDFSQSGNMDSDGPGICLAPGCGIGAEFNLVNIDYVQAGNAAVTGIISPFAILENQFLYSQDRDFPGFDDYTPSMSFDEESNLFVGTPVPLFPLGDCNLDGSVDFSDIPSMIAILMAGDYLPQADCNEDSVVNFSDIGPFIQILNNN